MRGQTFFVVEAFGGFRAGDVVDLSTGRLARYLTLEDRLELIRHSALLRPVGDHPGEVSGPATPVVPAKLRAME